MRSSRISRTVRGTIPASCLRKKPSFSVKESCEKSNATKKPFSRPALGGDTMYLDGSNCGVVVQFGVVAASLPRHVAA